MKLLYYLRSFDVDLAVLIQSLGVSSFPQYFSIVCQFEKILIQVRKIKPIHDDTIPPSPPQVIPSPCEDLEKSIIPCQNLESPSLPSPSFNFS